MNCIVVGYGSIGKRHVRILKELNCRVAVVSQRDIPYSLRYPNLYNAFKKENPDYIVIANQTKKHYDSLVELANYGFKGSILVEKPLFHTVKSIPNNNFKQGYVGYNLRFNPILQKIFQIIKKERTLYTQIYVGQYLPNWRSEQNYRMSYSAKRTEGGGVLLDLSHELDYLQWFFGDWDRIVAIGGKYSSLQISSDDMYSLMLVMKKCPMVQIHLNYLDRINRREITIITENYSIKADLVRQKLQINDELVKYNLNRDYTYYMQHKSIIDGENDISCTFSEGLKVLKMINIIEKSDKERKWISK